MKLLFCTIVICFSMASFGQTKPQVKVLRKGFNIDSLKRFQATERQNNVLGQQFYTLENGNRVYKAPQDNMPIIVPKVTGNMPMIKVDPKLPGMMPNPYTIPKDTVINLNAPKIPSNK